MYKIFTFISFDLLAKLIKFIASIQTNSLNENSSVLKIRNKDMSTKHNSKKIRLFEKQNHIKQMKTIWKQLKFSSKNLSSAGIDKATQKIKGRIARDSQKRNQFEKLIIK